MADLDACAKQILCGLSNAVLSALNVIIETQKVAIQALIIGYTAQLQVINVALAPAKAALAVAQTIVDQARSAANLVPLSAISNCGPLGDFSLDLNASLDAALADANALIADVNRLLSFADELQALVDSLTATLLSFADIQVVIAECALG